MSQLNTINERGNILSDVCSLVIWIGKVNSIHYIHGLHVYTYVSFVSFKKHIADARAK